MGRIKNRLLARALTRFPKLLDRLVDKTPRDEADGVPWTPFAMPLKEAKIAIVTTAGVHLRDQLPFDMKDPTGDPSYRELPADTPMDEYAITHDYYDHTDAGRDINIVFPIERLKELEADGVIGSVAATNYGFMGHIEGAHLDTLVNRTAPEVAGKIRSEGVDAVILTPG